MVLSFKLYTHAKKPRLKRGFFLILKSVNLAPLPASHTTP